MQRETRLTLGCSKILISKSFIIHLKRYDILIWDGFDRKLLEFTLELTC
jgi:hypothetical protein